MGLVQVLQPAGHATGVAVFNQYPSIIALQCPASGAEHVLQPVSQLMQVLVDPSGILPAGHAIGAHKAAFAALGSLANFDPSTHPVQVVPLVHV